MPKCFPIRFSDGSAGFVCGSFAGEKHCVVCGDFAERLCDFKLPDGKTCDAPICKAHATRVGRNLDMCPQHAPKESQPLLFKPEAV